MKIIKLTSVYIFLCLLIAGQSVWASSDKTEYLSLEEEISKIEKSDAELIKIVEEKIRIMKEEIRMMERGEPWEEKPSDETASKEEGAEEPIFDMQNCRNYGYSASSAAAINSKTGEIHKPSKQNEFNISYEKLVEKEYIIELLKQAEANNDVLLEKFKVKHTPIQELINYYISNYHLAAAESDEESTLSFKKSLIDLINIIEDTPEYEPEYGVQESFVYQAERYLQSYQCADYKERKLHIIEKALKKIITTNNNKAEFCVSGNKRKCKKNYISVTAEKYKKENKDTFFEPVRFNTVIKKQIIKCKENFVKATGDCQHDYTYLEEEKDAYDKNTLDISCKSFKNGKCQGGGKIEISEPACRCGNAYTTIILAKNKNNGWGYIIRKSQPHELTQNTFCLDYDIILNKCRQAKANEVNSEFTFGPSTVIPPIKTCTVKGDECYNDDGTKSTAKPTLSLNPDYLKYFALD